MRKIFSTGLAWLWIAIVVIIIDRFTKNWMMAHLALYEPYQLLPVFNLTLAYNKGAAFGFLHTASGWQNFLLLGVAIIISLVILYWLYKNSAREYWLNISLSFIIGGALGNAWDRILYSYVIDFFSFHIGNWYFAIFNTADSAICLGTIMLILYWLKK